MNRYATISFLVITMLLLPGCAALRPAQAPSTACDPDMVYFAGAPVECAGGSLRLADVSTDSTALVAAHSTTSGLRLAVDRTLGRIQDRRYPGAAGVSRAWIADLDAMQPRRLWSREYRAARRTAFRALKAGEIGEADAAIATMRCSRGIGHVLLCSGEAGWPTVEEARKICAADTSPGCGFTFGENVALDIAPVIVNADLEQSPSQGPDGHPGQLLASHLTGITPDEYARSLGYADYAAYIAGRGADRRLQPACFGNGSEPRENVPVDPR